MYLSPSIQLSFMTAISPFWSVPLTPPPPGSSLKAYGHYEMLAPTFFVLFTVLPLLASLLFFEFVRDYNVHRHTARRVLAVSALLRRKSPHFKSIPGLQWVRDFCYGELLFIAFLVIGNVVLFVYGWINQRRVPLAQAIRTTSTRFWSSVELYSATAPSSTWRSSFCRARVTARGWSFSTFRTRMASNTTAGLA
ncbi:hypothetical protein PR003_g5746 [Phytophthora rubi]|uniref:Uncharacterized protein n=1 Tax=Phytophthora rubi TaxID=129364 RepID=A0A6A4FIM2_9STRA|nr:hypothetical protein PR003_g5746 [Phytophthora rubi]